ncbi:hypothetical protein JCM8097_007750 [Rhodosporidiobolus ruineniae]
MSSSTLTPLASSIGAPSPPTLSPSSTSLAFSSSSSVPTTPYTAYRASALATLRALVDRSQAQADVGEGEMRSWVDEAVNELNDAAGVQDGDERWKKDARQTALARAAEELASSSVRPLLPPSLLPLTPSNFKQAIYPPTPLSSAQLTATLDLVLALQEAGHVDELLPLSILTSLMELRPVGGCEELVGYIESRVSRLTKNWDPQRARGPVLLRLLNDLLRRLPRSQSSSVILSGRILLLLSSVFPLGDKSSVNLRGSFNVGKGAVWETQAEREMEGAREDARKEDEEKEKEQREDGGKMEVEEGEEAEPGEDKGEGNPAKDNPSAFYTLFWSLQRYFTNPPLLFVPQPSSADPSSTPFGELKAGLEQTLKAFEAQTRRERELAGGVKEEGAKKKKAEDVEEAEGGVEAEELEEYFFPKFLTSRNLLDLELASPTFRLQLLVQTLILAQYLLTFTPTSRARLTALPLTNPAAYSSFVLPEETEKWVRELSGRAEEEMGRMEGGEGVRRAVKAVLEREQNWTDWKLRSCPPILRHPSSAPAAQSETARKKLKALGTRPKAYPFRMGNAQLARAWGRNTTTLEECSPSEDAHPSLDALLREHRLESARLKQAEQQAARAAPGSGKRVELQQAAESRRTRLASLSWLIIRLSPSAGHLALLSRIGAGDVSKLAELIDEERRAKEAAEEAKEEELERVREEGEGGAGGEAEGGGGDSGAESDASDQSALGLRREEKERRARVEREREEREKQERERKEREEKEEREKKEREEREREAGTPPPPGGEVEMKDAHLASASAPSSATATPTPAAEEESTTPPPPSRPSASSSSSTPAPTAPPAGQAQEEPGTPPPPSGTPPPKSTTTAQAQGKAQARLRSPGTPGTPKRLREEDEEGDVEMRDGEGAGGGKKQRME